MGVDAAAKDAFSDKKKVSNEVIIFKHHDTAPLYRLLTKHCTYYSYILYGKQKQLSMRVTWAFDLK